MAKGLVNESTLNNLGNAINVLNGTSGTYHPSEMAAEILDVIPDVTVEGNPIHITDAAAYPAESVVTTLEPVQDLHGYDKPWPAGGGKNLFDKDAAVTGLLRPDGTIATSYDNWKTSNFIEVEGFTDIYISGVQDSMATARGGAWYDSDKTFLSYFIMSTVIEDGHLTVPPNAVYIRFSIVTTNLNTAQLELGSTATSYEPYSNICPITGYTGVALMRTGKNLLDSSTVVRGSLNKDTGAPTGGTTRIRSDFILLKAGSYISSNLTMQQVVCVYDIDANKSFIKEESYNTSWHASVFSFTLAGDRYVRIAWKINDATAIYPSDLQNAQLELGSTATTYEPYTPETHSQTFPQAQSPIFGCEVDWANGVLRVTKVNVDLGALTWGLTSRGYFVAAVPDIKRTGSDTELANVKCSIYKTDTSYNIYYNRTDKAICVAVNSDDIWVADSGYSSASDFKTAMSGVQLVYELATPIEIPLTPEVITLLKGENNVWTDAGTSEVQYKVDLNSYIQKLIDEASGTT